MNQDVIEFTRELKDLSALEQSLCKQEKVKKTYADYTLEPKEPPIYRNRASLGMISLSATWVIFDVFAYVMKYTKIAIGASIFTALLVLLFVVLQVRGRRAQTRLLNEYEEYAKIYELVKMLEKPNQRTRKVLEKLYEKSNVYERYRNLNAVCALYEYLDTDKASEIYGAASVYHICGFCLVFSGAHTSFVSRHLFFHKSKICQSWYQCQTSSAISKNGCNLWNHSACKDLFLINLPKSVQRVCRFLKS